MARALRILQVGLGPVGQSIAHLILETEGLQLVGAADRDSGRIGKDLGTVLGLPRKLRVKVLPDVRKLIRSSPADMAIVATSSSLRDVKDDVALLLQKGVNVISTCEELAFPINGTQTMIRELDALARRKKVRILGAGVNPGFAMDALALMFTAASTRISRVAVTRVVDVATRRLPLQRKVGAGLNVNQFRRAASEGTVRHVGLLQSAHIIATALGWKLDRVEETLEPATAPRDLDTENLRIPAGAAAGLKQYVRAYRGGDLAISLDLQMYIGAESPRDHILVDGVPMVDVTIAGGLSGDLATAALIVNSMPKMLRAPGGWISMRDLALPHQMNPAELKTLLPRVRAK